MTHKRQDNRKRCYTLLQLAKKQLGLDEDTYRSILAEFGATEVKGRISATTMDIGQLFAAVEHMRAKGFRSRSRRDSNQATSTDWRKKRIGKITAIWCALHEAGVVRDPSVVAMERWCSTLTKTARLEWAGSYQLNDCIEALKSWAYREKVQLKP